MRLYHFRVHCSYGLLTHSRNVRYIESLKWLCFHHQMFLTLINLNQSPLKTKTYPTKFGFWAVFLNLNLEILCGNLLKAIWNHSRLHFPADEAYIEVCHPHVLCLPTHTIFILGPCRHAGVSNTPSPSNTNTESHSDPYQYHSQEQVIYNHGV